MSTAPQLSVFTPPISRVHVGAVPIHKITLQESMDLIDQRLSDRNTSHPFLVVPVNAQLVVLADCESRFAQLTNEAHLCLADGFSTLMASRLMGNPLPERIAGVDLMMQICEGAALKRSRVFLIGGRPGAAAKAAAFMQKQNPGLEIAGVACPPLGFERLADYSQQLCAEVRRSRADIVFVAFGAPKQEYWMQEHAHLLGAKLIMAVGGSFDFVAGLTRRAPRWVQNIGFEWLFRVVLEPRRLWRRYLFGNVHFCWLIMRQFVKGLSTTHS